MRAIVRRPSDRGQTLWKAADKLRADAGLKPSDYACPVLGLLFLRYAESRFNEMARTLKPAARSRRSIGPADFISRGVIYLPEDARYSRLIVQALETGGG